MSLFHKLKTLVQSRRLLQQQKDEAFHQEVAQTMESEFARLQDRANQLRQAYERNNQELHQLMERQQANFDEQNRAITSRFEEMWNTMDHNRERASPPLFVLSRLLHIRPSQATFSGMNHALHPNVNFSLIHQLKGNEFEDEFLNSYCAAHLGEMTPENVDAHVASYTHHKINDQCTMEYLDDIEFDLNSLALSSEIVMQRQRDHYALLNQILNPKTSVAHIRAKLGEPYNMYILQHLPYSYQDSIASKLDAIGMHSLTKNFQHHFIPFQKRVMSIPHCFLY